MASGAPSITKEAYNKLLEGQQKGSKTKKKKPPVDYAFICALPHWKTTQRLVGSDGFVTFYTFPIPPSANTYWRNVNGKTLVSEDARNYKKAIAALAHRLGMRPLTGKVKLTLEFYRNQASGDLSNRLKVIEDALIGVAYIDDKQIVEEHLYRYDDKGNGRIVISVVEVS